MSTHELSDIVNAAAIANRLGVVQPTVTMWGKRYKDFPQPLDAPGITIKVYSWAAVSAWHQAREAHRRISLVARAERLRREYDEVQSQLG